MSVEKLSDLSQTIIEDVPFSQISNFVIEHIKDNDAFRIWSFCFSKSKNWKVYKDFTEKVCGIGSRKGEYVWSYLSRCKLIEYERIIDKESGKFIRTDIKILNGTKFNPNEPFLKEKTTPAKTADVVETTPALSAAAVSAAAEMYPLRNKDITNTEHYQNERESKKPLSVDNFKNEETKKLCNVKNLNIENEFKKFSNHYQEKEISLGKFINWLTRANPEPKSTARNESLEDYIKRFMKDTRCTETEARDYYRLRGFA